MTQSLFEICIQRIEMTHRSLIETTEDLTEDQFSWVPGSHAPPSGWHLWHIARWTDRVQASFPAADGAPVGEVWEDGQYCAAWGLNPTSLGVLQSGLGMDQQAAVEVVRQAGQARILAYAKRSFAACDSALDRLCAADLETIRDSISAFHIDENQRVVPAPPANTTVAADLAFHFSHASRHLGMIEGLRGALGLHGTASV